MLTEKKGAFRMNKTTAASYASSSIQPTFGNWIAFDLEWELEPQPEQNYFYSQKTNDFFHL
jgi:hypothetical protein